MCWSRSSLFFIFCCIVTIYSTLSDYFGFTSDGDRVHLGVKTGEVQLPYTSLWLSRSVGEWTLIWFSLNSTHKWASGEGVTVGVSIFSGWLWKVFKTLCHWIVLIIKCIYYFKESSWSALKSICLQIIKIGKSKRV